jgi:predicted glycosyltransferase
MRILFDLNHPAHFHLLKNAINELKRKGHQIWITARKKDVLLDLLDINIQEYILLDKSKNKIKDHFRNLIKLRRVFKKESIDLAIGVSVLITQASLFTKTKSIVLDDDDFKATPLFALASHTFANHILVPEVLKNTKKKYIYHQGFHELAYLHPKRFKADINILKQIGVKKEEPYFVLRFVALKGHHDVGHKGISLDQKRQLINYLATYGHIFITSEKQIEDEFEKIQITDSSRRNSFFIILCNYVSG